MISTLGTTLVLGGLLAAAFGAVVGIEGGLRHRPGALKIVLGTVTAFLDCMLGANLTMVYALVTHDFSVHYVAQVGSRATPMRSLNIWGGVSLETTWTEGAPCLSLSATRKVRWVWAASQRRLPGWTTPPRRMVGP